NIKNKFLNFGINIHEFKRLSMYLPSKEKSNSIYKSPVKQVPNVKKQLVTNIYNISRKMGDGFKGMHWKRVLSKIDSQIFLRRSGSEGIKYISKFTKKTGKKFIFNAAHIKDCDLSFKKEDWTNNDKIVQKNYIIGLKNADLIIVLANYMKVELEKYLKDKDIRVVTNGFPIVPEHELLEKTHPPFILWAARFVSFKNPNLVLKIANSLPKYNFIMCGDGPLFKDIFEKAKNIPNLKLLGYVHFKKINELFNMASVFLNTSSSEGFPNTYIQAWYRKTPVVSMYVDPDEIICKNNLGLHSDSIDKIVEYIELLLNDDKLRSTIGINCRKYAIENHNIKKVADQHYKIYKELIS
ncbi:MAG: glycosyltransferase family 4 protein, partial [Promethearchaeota archaeon]